MLSTQTRAFISIVSWVDVIESYFDLAMLDHIS